MENSLIESPVIYKGRFLEQLCNNSMVLVSILCCIVYSLTRNNVVCLPLAILVCLIGVYKAWVKPSFWINIVLFISVGAMGLWPKIKLLGGVFSWGDIGIIVVLLMIVYIFMNRIKYRYNKIGFVALLYLLFMIIGSLVGYIIYKQNPLVGLLVFRTSYIYLAIIPIMAMLQNKIITSKNIFDSMLSVIKVYSIVCLIFYLCLTINIDLCNYGHSFRWGPRIYASNVLQFTGLMLIVVKALDSKLDLKNMIWGLLFLAEVILINQSRVLIFSYIIACLTIILTFNKLNNKPIIFAIILAIACMIIAVPSIRNTIVESFNESANNLGTMDYRNYELIYFNSMLEGHEVFGVGIPNMNFGEAAKYSGKNIEVVIQGFHLNGAYTSDLGIYAVKYYFGYVGYIIFLCLILYQTLKSLYKIIIKKSNSVYEYLILGTMVSIIVSSNTINHLFEMPDGYMVLFILIALEKYSAKEVRK